MLTLDKVYHAQYVLKEAIRETDVIYGKSFEIGELKFSFGTDQTLMLYVRGNAVLFDVGGFSQLPADLSVELGCGTLKYFLGYGIIFSV